MLTNKRKPIWTLFLPYAINPTVSLSLSWLSWPWALNGLIKSTGSEFWNTGIISRTLQPILYVYIQENVKNRQLFLLNYTKQWLFLLFTLLKRSLVFNGTYILSLQIFYKFAKNTLALTVCVTNTMLKTRDKCNKL